MKEEHSEHKTSDTLLQGLGDDASLHEVSQAFRAAEAQDAVANDAETRAAFGTIHARLMDRIAEDTAATFVAASPVPSARRWPWAAPANLRPPRPLWKRAALGAVMASLMMGFTWSAHEVGRQRSPHELPLQPFIDDFDMGIKSPAPFEFTAYDASGSPEQAGEVAREAANWLSVRSGIPIEVPPAHGPGLTLIGARHSVLGQRSVAQTHYLHSGMRVALYQIRDAEVGLNSMEPVKIAQRTYLTANRDPYRIVVWRSGEDVLTLVSPLAMRESLLVAQRLREAEEQKTEAN